MLNRIGPQAESGMRNMSGAQSGWWRVGVQAVLMLAILAAGLGAMNYLIAAAPTPPKRPPIPTAYAVETMAATRGDHRPSFTVYGEIVAARTVELRSLVAGEVTAISDSLKVGNQVEKGQALVEIDKFDYQGAVREARANLAETMARIEESNARIEIEESKLARALEQQELAERDLERLKALRSSGTATDKQQDDRELVLSQRIASVEQTRINISAETAKLEQQRAAADRLGWKVEQAERNLANTTLVAPFAGIVRSAAVERGKMLNVNDIAVSLYEGANLEVGFTLTDERFARLRADPAGLAGRKIEVVWSARGASINLSGRIDRIGADVAAERGGVQVFAALDADPAAIALRPGAFVEVRVPDRLFAGHYRIPESAIYSGNTVYAVVDSRLQARAVTVNAYDGEFALATGAIGDGDEILVTRITEIGEGLRVEPTRRNGANVAGRASGKAAVKR